MFKKLNVKGVSHHILLPILAILVVAGIGGFVMQRSSSAASKCSSRTFSVGARSECVRDIQTIVGAGADGAYGPNTAKKVKSVLGGTGNTVTPAGWKKLCTRALKKANGNTSNAYHWSYEHACLGKSKITPSTMYTAYTKCFYVPQPVSSVPKKPHVPTCNKKYVATKALAKSTTAKSNRAAIYKKYNADLTKWKTREVSTVKCTYKYYPNKYKASYGVPPKVDCGYVHTTADKVSKIKATNTKMKSQQKKDVKTYNNAPKYNTN